MNQRTPGLLCIVTLLILAMMSGNIGAQEPSAEELDAQATKLHEQGRYQEAIPLRQRVLAINEKVRGPSDPATASSLHELAVLYYSTREFDKAEPLYLRALAIREKALGPEHADTAVTLNSLASLYYTTRAYVKAEPLYLRALAIREKALGPEHPDTARVLNNLGALYQQMGEGAKAEPLYLRALSIREKVLGPDNSNTVATLQDLVALYRDTQDYAKAEPLLQRLLTIREKSFGPDHSETAPVLDELAELYKVTGAYGKAEPLLQRALAIREKEFGPEDVRTAFALDKLGWVYHATAAYEKAEALYQRELAIFEKEFGPEDRNTAGALNNLADSIYHATGDYEKAEPLYQRAIAIQEKAYGPGHSETAATINNLAAMYYDVGAYEKAEPLYQRSLAIREKAVGRENPATAQSLNNLANLYVATGAREKAEPLLERALAIMGKERGPEHPDTATALNNLAYLYRTTGAYAKAEPLYGRALAIYEKAFGPEHPFAALAMNNLAVLYAIMGAYEKAEALQQRALEINEKALGPEHPATATSLDNLAVLYWQTGAYAKAEPLFQRALAIREKVLGSEHRDTAGSLNNLAQLYLRLGAYKKAEPLYQRAIAIEEKVLGPEHPDNMPLLGNLAGLYYVMGEYGKTEQLLRRSGAIAESATRRFLLTGSEARQRAYVQGLMRFVYFSVQLALGNPTAQSTEQGITSVLRYKGRVLDEISGGAARLRRSSMPQDREILDSLSNVAQQLSMLTFSPPPKLSPEAVRVRLHELYQEQERLEAQVSSRSGELLETVTPVTLERVRQALPGDTVLLEWFRYVPVDRKAEVSGTPHYAVFVVGRHGKIVTIDLGPAQPIEDLIGEYRRALSDPTTTYHMDIAKELSQKLIKPLRPHLRHVERLLFSPDAALNLVPFAALVDEHGEYLVQHFEITYLTSGRDLLRMANEPPPRSGAVVLADPSYGTSGGEGLPREMGLRPIRSADLDRGGLVFNPLPGTAAESAALQSLLGLDANHVLTGDRATEASLRELHGPRILHVATHAFFLDDTGIALGPARQSPEAGESLGENPLLRSGLALAGANARRSGDSDDGILTAVEVARLDLSGTQLAVLSACETGVGTLQTGEGIYGLRRALVLAGAQAQLVSLWKVSDSATRDLMVEYYRRLLRGEGRSAALRGTQRAMVADPARQHPYYWATFVPIGDWRPLAPEHGRLH
jgi:CHAT domain-containing protein/tetratricopeptide (TPR) repeat protein